MVYDFGLYKFHISFQIQSQNQILDSIPLFIQRGLDLYVPILIYSYVLCVIQNKKGPSSGRICLQCNMISFPKKVEIF